MMKIRGKYLMSIEIWRDVERGSRMLRGSGWRMVWEVFQLLMSVGNQVSIRLLLMSLRQQTSGQIDIIFFDLIYQTDH